MVHFLLPWALLWWWQPRFDTCAPTRGRNDSGYCQAHDQEGNVRIFVFICTKAFGELRIDDVTLTPHSDLREHSYEVRLAKTRVVLSGM